MHGVGGPLLNEPQFVRRGSLSPTRQNATVRTIVRRVSFDEPTAIRAVSSGVTRVIRGRLLARRRRTDVRPRLVMRFFRARLKREVIRTGSMQERVPFDLSFPTQRVCSS